MTTQSWLPLTDYSLKYKVSISTLRRRIKTEKIQFRFDDGKYFIHDSPIDSHHGEENENTQPVIARPQPSVEQTETASRMLEEIKKAYTLILQEKQEQILQLKEEIADLRTLVRALEGENQRLNDLLQKQGGKPQESLPQTFY